MSVSIYDALKQVPNDKSEYFRWKFDIRFSQDAPRKTEEEFLVYSGRRTMNTFIRWERTDEYKNLVSLYLNSRTANDLIDIYKVVAVKAKEGDDKYIKLFLSLDKEIREHAKIAIKTFSQVEDTKDEDDGLQVK